MEYWFRGDKVVPAGYYEVIEHNKTNNGNIVVLKAGPAGYWTVSVKECNPNATENHNAQTSVNR